MGNADVFEFSRCRTGGQSQGNVSANFGENRRVQRVEGRRPVNQSLTNTGWEPCRGELFIREGWRGMRAGVCPPPKELCCYLFKYIINKQTNTQ